MHAHTPTCGQQCSIYSAIPWPPPPLFYSYVMCLDMSCAHMKHSKSILCLLINPDWSTMQYSVVLEAPYDEYL